MSYAITTAQVQQYKTNVAMLLQQQGSRLRSTVRNETFMGKAASMVEQFGSVSAQLVTSRHSDTPLISVPQDRRWIFPRDYVWADLVDKVDKLRLLIDPTSQYAMAGAWAMGRAIDDEIISGVFNSNATGENGTTPTGLLSAFGGGSQVVAGNVGASAATGLNIAKLRRAKLILYASEVDIDTEEMYVAITAKQHDDLLNETQAISLDYNSKPVLVDGKIDTFMGFKFVHSERIPGGASFNAALNPNILTGSTDGTYATNSRFMVPFWCKSGVVMGAWNDIKTSVDLRPDKMNATQVMVTGTFGASRTEEKRVGFINCI